MADWDPQSWRSRTATQIPQYPVEGDLSRVVDQLKLMPPIVTTWEIERLKRQLAEVATGARFLIQGGDCSERFEECRPDLIAGKLKVLLQMSLVLLDASKMKVTRVGRLAGQYAKPRSSPFETRDGVTLPAYQGDLINRPGFSEAERRPDPENMMKGYQLSAVTLNFVRGMVAGDYSELDFPAYWNLDFAKGSANAATYEQIINRIVDSMQFMKASVGAPLSQLTKLDFFTSHEGMHLYYEEALTRRSPYRSGWYNVGTHFPWIGERTRALTGAHVEYFRGIQNPVAVKVGPRSVPEEIVELAALLNPEDEPGKLTLIHRFGASEIERCLPPLIQAIQRAERTVVWCCDPMHGNTALAAGGIKTRNFEDIIQEVRKAFQVHQEMGSFLGGVHFELTGEHVTECVGGAGQLSEADLKRAYRSLVDPRLNQEQALEMALQVGQVMQKWGATRAAKVARSQRDGVLVP